MACGPDARQATPERPWSLRSVKNRLILKGIGGEMVFFPLKIKPFLISIFLILHFPLSVFGAAITDIRFWSAPDHTRVVLDLTEPVQYESSSQENPPQCRVELTGITSLPKKKELKFKDKYLQKISLTDLGKGKARLVLHQKTPLQANIFTLKPDLGKPHRLVIDLIDVGQEKKDQEERQKQKEVRSKGTKIVVIDPGHGGEDPGAVGPRKTLEKDIVLKVGEKAIHLLNQQREVKAFLTRKGDYFIPLEQRVRIAREYNADLFISLHADGSFNPQARGSSVYCLSLSGASDQAAKLLADKENMSNILGGAFLRPASLSKDPNLNQILLDLMQNNSMKESFRFAELTLDEMKEIHPLKYSSYRQANFIVLRAPDIPSVLVEVAYITNKEDERILNQSEFQEKIAKSLVNAILKYFN
ncbi:MAG: AMIN domain-containing protein [Deltaproteobacteria bacterium]|nr:AMIN domain-containing protein [Deltaproteobacteria bacterium]